MSSGDEVHGLKSKIQLKIEDAIKGAFSGQDVKTLLEEKAVVITVVTVVRDCQIQKKD